MKAEGNKGLFVTRKSRCTWSVATVSLRLSVLNGLHGCFGQKKALCRHELHSFGRELSGLAPPPRGATVEFWLRTWIW